MPLKHNLEGCLVEDAPQPTDKMCFLWFWHVLFVGFWIYHLCGSISISLLYLERSWQAAQLSSLLHLPLMLPLSITDRYWGQSEGHVIHVFHITDIFKCYPVAALDTGADWKHVVIHDFDVHLLRDRWFSQNITELHYVRDVRESLLYTPATPIKYF